MTIEETIREIVRSAIEPLEKKIDEISAKIAPPDTKEIGGVEFAVEITGFKKTTIYSLTSKRKIPHSKRGNKLFFDRNELMKWAKENKRKFKG